MLQLPSLISAVSVLAQLFNLYTYMILYEFLAIIFTLEQPTYTIIESNNTLSVCVDLIQGQLAREVSFNLSYHTVKNERLF